MVRVGQQNPGWPRDAVEMSCRVLLAWAQICVLLALAITMSSPGASSSGATASSVREKSMPSCQVARRGVPSGLPQTTAVLLVAPEPSSLTTKSVRPSASMSPVTRRRSGDWPPGNKSVRPSAGAKAGRNTG